jgi:hypothetical protein
MSEYQTAFIYNGTAVCYRKSCPIRNKEAAQQTTLGPSEGRTGTSAGSSGSGKATAT